VVRCFEDSNDPSVSMQSRTFIELSVVYLVVKEYIP
jgi:hypothetical protein